MPNDLPAQTVPESFQVQVCGFEDNERAERMGYIVGQTVAALSRNIDLSRLAGISIVTDFDAALRELDRGFETSRPLCRTKDNVAEGVAMTPMVRRDGINKWYLMLNAPYFIPLEEVVDKPGVKSDALAVALHTLVHECAHVQISAHFDEKFPGRFNAPWRTDEEVILLQPVLAAWDEYAANCLAGPYCTEYLQGCSEDTFVGYLSVARENCQAGINRFYQHQNWLELFEDAGRAIFEPVRGLAYLLGDMEGASVDWGAFPAARKALDADPLYKRLAEPIHSELRKLWESWYEWDSFAVFAPLMEIAHTLYCEMGIHLHRCPDGRVIVNIK